MGKNDGEMEAQKTAGQPTQTSDVATAETFVTVDEDILDLQDLDPALNLKMYLVNNVGYVLSLPLRPRLVILIWSSGKAIDEIGWTPYHTKLFFLNGFG